jgi:diacylglycerol kinase (ATP)
LSLGGTIDHPYPRFIFALLNLYCQPQPGRAVVITSSFRIAPPDISGRCRVGTGTLPSSIVVFVNPLSRGNRRDPGLAGRFAETLRGGELGRVVSPDGLENLAIEARRLAAAPPAVIAIHGGDGTLHRALGALIHAFSANPEALPPLAILPGGTMNVVARSLDIMVRRPERMLADLAEDLRAGRPLPTLVRRCLQVGESFGFVFGNGLMANFLEEYYRDGGYGPRRAMWILTRTFLSAVVRGPYARRMFRTFAGRVWVDGQPLPWGRLTGLGVATVREVGLGFKLNHRADEDPDRFSVLAIHAGPVALAADLVPVHQGRGIAPKRAWSAVATQLAVEAEDPKWSYTIDGDLYRAEGRIEVGLGPPLRIVRPRRR